MPKILFLLSILFISTELFSQPLLTDTDIPHLKTEQLLNSGTYSLREMSKGTKTTATDVFDTARWTHIIDSTWGVGISNTEKLSLFDQIWKSFDSTYPCYIHLPQYNWDSIVNEMRTEISAGVSRGRFAGILTTLRRYINDGHTFFYDLGIMYPTNIYPGLPVFRSTPVNFGACITMLPDSSAMVYDAEPGHPFGLQPGDIILGYNNMPWSELIQLLIHYEMPSPIPLGSTNAATYHSYVAAIGGNWHLFDTINIKKCDGSMISFPTSLMITAPTYTRLCTEQMAVPGVERLTYQDYYQNNITVKYGMLQGAGIGYIYMQDCSDTSGKELYNATKTLLEDSNAVGIILDIRSNYGGSFRAFYKAFQYLMQGNTAWVSYGERPLPSDRYLMQPQTGYSYDVIDTDPSSSNKPFAILCGPKAISAGDFLQILFKKHPFVRTFGKSTAGAYGGLSGIPLTNSNYYAAKQQANFYEISNPGYYLSHTEYPIDQPVWYNKDSVCAGRDNVVGEAVKWIYGKLSVEGISGNANSAISIYPNPATSGIDISITSSTNEAASLRVMNMYGVVLIEKNVDLKQGANNIHIDFINFYLPQGNYLISTESASLGRMTERFSKTD